VPPSPLITPHPDLEFIFYFNHLFIWILFEVIHHFLN
jgi:hypothetical protein